MIHGDVDTSMIIVPYGILKTDRLFFEFMDEVFRDKLTYQEMNITDRDFYSYFETKRQHCKSVAQWVDYTFYKLQQVYIRILFEAGLKQKNDLIDQKFMLTNDDLRTAQAEIKVLQRGIN